MVRFFLYFILIFLLSLVFTHAKQDLNRYEFINNNIQSSEILYELYDYKIVAERYEQIGDFSFISVDYISNKDLKKNIKSTIGETLSWEPGVNSSYFGPGSSRPIIRGLGDFRVRMLLNGIGTFDVSDNSPDHAIPIDPQLVKSIHIHRGPDALLFGNSAIGGVVNIETYLIPETLINKNLSYSIQTKIDSASNGISESYLVNSNIDNFVFSFTNSFRNNEDYDIPGLPVPNNMKKNIIQ